MANPVPRTLGLTLSFFLGGSIQPGLVLCPNSSGRFESRFLTLGIEESPSLMLRGMAGSTLGIWLAHGEGNPLGKNLHVLTKFLALAYFIIN